MYRRRKCVSYCTYYCSEIEGNRFCSKKCAKKLIVIHGRGDLFSVLASLVWPWFSSLPWSFSKPHTLGRKVGLVTIRSRLEKRRDKTRPSRSRLVSWLRLARRSRIDFFVSKKITLKTANFGGTFGPIFLLSLVSSLVTFWSQDGTDETVSISSRLVTCRLDLVSLPALAES